MYVDRYIESLGKTVLQHLDSLRKPYKIFASDIEDAAMLQFIDYMNQDWVVKGAMMPDAHTGYSLPIGAVIACDGVISPQAVGYDIGCGMCALPTTFMPAAVRAHSQAIFSDIYRAIPVGFNHNKVDSVWPEEPENRCTPELAKIFIKNGLKQLGTLGSGNHFIEIGEDSIGIVWIIIHSGSRGIGHAVATHYMRLASGDGKAREGHFGFEAASDLGQHYIVDLTFCLEFALENRRQMMRRVLDNIGAYVDGAGIWEALINRNHNHAELKDGLWIHRKGATHAENGMKGVIPGNMRDGSFIVRGKGNPDSLCSSSHGAGRIMGRKEAERVLSMNDFHEQMRGVKALVDTTTLDESPGAYKNIFEVMELQKDLVEVVAHVKPIINVKG